MESYPEMKERHRKEFGALPIAFGFNERQFREGMKKLGLDPADTGNVAGIGAGGFCRKETLPLIKETVERHTAEMESAIAADETGEGFIFEMLDYELGNHEFCITWDVEPALESVGLTMEEVKKSPALSHGLKLAKINQSKRPG
jgi:hypothetical protein